MRIGIIGAGRVGTSLGRRWIACDHEVIFGVRDPGTARHRGLTSRLDGPEVTTVSEAAERARVLLLAVPWTSAREAIEAAGDLSDKVVIDCINPLAPDHASLLVGETDSAAEQIARWAPDARVVKTFNIFEAGILSESDFGTERCTMFLCGDCPEAKELVSRLGEDLGFEMIDAGPLEVARELESLAVLMMTLAQRGRLGPRIALRLLRRGESESAGADWEREMANDRADLPLRIRRP